MDLNPRHVMIDLETLDTMPSAAVLSVGAVEFGPQGIGEVFYSHFNVQSQLNIGRSVSYGTLRWWMQHEAAEGRREIFMKGSIKYPVRDVLGRLREFCDGAAGIWGNGASFDNAMIHSLAKDFEEDPIWPFWLDRCFRTLKAEFDPRKDLQPKGAHNNHVAYVDAMNQAAWAVNILREYNPAWEVNG